MASSDLVLTQLCHKKNNRWYSILQGQWDGYSILFSPSVFIGYLFKMEKVKQVIMAHEMNDLFIDFMGKVKLR